MNNSFDSQKKNIHAYWIKEKNNWIEDVYHFPLMFPVMFCYSQLRLKNLQKEISLQWKNEIFDK